MTNFKFYTLPENKLNRTEVWVKQEDLVADSRKEASKTALKSYKSGTYKIRKS